MRARPSRLALLTTQVDPLAGGLDERAAVLGIRDVARDRGTRVRPAAALSERIGPRASTTSVQPRSSSAPRQRQPEPARRSVTIPTRATGAPSQTCGA
jgi:hypothetical protein